MEDRSTELYINTDVIIRLLTSDDLKKQKAAASLFEDVFKEKIVLLAPATVIVQAVHILSSPQLYNLPRAQIRNLLTTLIRLPNFKLENKQTVLHALDLYSTSTLTFENAFIVASAKQTVSKEIYSFDRDLDKMEGIKRKSP